MIRNAILAIALAGMTSGAAYAQAPAEEAQAQRPYSVETTPIGVLLDDPEASAILERIIPTVYVDNLFRTIGRPNTLRIASQYASELTPAKMAAIQAEFDKMPASEK